MLEGVTDSISSKWPQQHVQFCIFSQSPIAFETISLSLAPEWEGTAVTNSVQRQPVLLSGCLPMEPNRHIVRKTQPQEEPTCRCPTHCLDGLL